MTSWFSDPVRFRQYGTGACYLLGGSLFLLGMVATNWEGDRSMESYLDSLAANPARAQAAALLLHFAGIFTAAALFGTVALVRARGVRLAHAALVLGVLGATTMPGLLIIDFYDLAIAQTLPRAQGVAVENQVGTYPGLILFALPAFVGFILGMVLAGLAMWRAGFAPLWVPLAILAGYATSEGTRGTSISPALTSAISATILLVAFAYLGVRILRMDRQEWTTGVPTGRNGAQASLAAAETSA